MGTIFRFAFLVCLSLAVPALADEAKPPPDTAKPADAPKPPPTQEQITLETFGREHAACHEWSDGCAVCTRQGDALACSLPGIACTPAAVTCRADEKKDTSPEPPAKK